MPSLQTKALVVTPISACLPSSLDSKAEERKYVSNVLKANGYTKTFLRNCQKPVTTSNTLDECIRRYLRKGVIVFSLREGLNCVLLRKKEILLAGLTNLTIR